MISLSTSHACLVSSHAIRLTSHVARAASLVAGLALAVSSASSFAKSTSAPEVKSPTTNAPSIYDVSLTNIDGKPETLKQYKGKTLLIVNTASKCGYTKQYEGLEKIYAKYKEQGFTILGFPSNDFGGQEPGSDKEIKAFCTKNYKVAFPMFSKGAVKGNEKQDLFKYLTESAPTKGEIKWNFEKFLVNKQGQVVGRFGSSVTPESDQLTRAIEDTLKPANM